MVVVGGRRVVEVLGAGKKKPRVTPFGPRAAAYHHGTSKAANPYRRSKDWTLVGERLDWLVQGGSIKRTGYGHSRYCTVAAQSSSSSSSSNGSVAASVKLNKLKPVGKQKSSSVGSTDWMDQLRLHRRWTKSAVKQPTRNSSGDIPQTVGPTIR